MTDVTITKQFAIKVSDLKRLWKEDEDFKADRERGAFRVRYMAHADGYVMARRPGAVPFVLGEKEWRALRPFNDGQSSGGR